MDEIEHIREYVASWEEHRDVAKGAPHRYLRTLLAALDAEKARRGAELAQLRASIAALLVEGESWVAAGPLRALLEKP